MIAIYIYPYCATSHCIATECLWQQASACGNINSCLKDQITAVVLLMPVWFATSCVCTVCISPFSR